MTENNDQCYRCIYFDRLYAKGAQRFEMTKFGVCRVDRKNVGIHETCERYEHRPRGKTKRTFLPHCLHMLLAEITAIRELIEAEDIESEEV